MPSIIKNADAEKCLRSILISQGYSLSEQLNHGQTGVDIIASGKGEKIHIEVIGHKSKGPARAKDFYQVFFRAISRIKDGASRLVIALPHLAERGLPLRARHYDVAWTRIGEAFPELEIWLIDVDNHTYSKHSWNEWLIN